MNSSQLLFDAGEKLPWPDWLSRAAIRYLIGRTRRRLAASVADAERQFALEMARYPIAIATEAANAQHYEIPERFFSLILGAQRKYSCCLYEHGIDSLDAAEERALAVTSEHAGLADGQRILELGCGWGSLSLWMARKFRSSSIVAVSNSSSQGEFIRISAQREGLSNLTVLTADMNSFAPGGRFDRIVSVEMFEHMSNWRALLGRLRGVLTPGGSLFLHVFTHARAPYRFSTADKKDWIAQYYFTGGIMPSHRLIRQFADCFEVAEEWRWSGQHYRRTARDWLKNFDSNQDAISELSQRIYGADANLWLRRWRLFFLATMELFGDGRGEEWGVSHYRLNATGQ
jgi:cyclopropane-fatty-acyl-phospholipid synthase